MTLTWTVLATLATGVLSVLAAALMAFAFVRRSITSQVSYAVSVLLAAAFLDLLPQAAEYIGWRASFWPLCWTRTTGVQAVEAARSDRFVALMRLAHQFSPLFREAYRTLPPNRRWLGTPARDRARRGGH